MQSDKLNKRLIDFTLAELLQVLEHHPAGATKASNQDNNVVSNRPQIRKVPLKILAKTYGWSKATLYRWCQERYIPHFKVGHELWFDVEEIDRWMEEKRIRTKEQIITDFEKGKTFYNKTNKL